MLCALTIVATSGCEKEQVDAVPTTDFGQRIKFAPAIMVEDESVNQFVRDAMKTCFSGDYTEFRKLWSDGGSSFTAEQYERGWKKADRIEVVRLAPVNYAERVEDAFDEEGNLKTTRIYYVVANVELAADIRNPTREVVLLIRPENGQWRFQHPPKAFFDQLERSQSAMSEAASRDASQSSTSDPQG